jgi:segregation and condensation protein A
VAESEVRCGQWSGGLGDLIAAFEAGAADPRQLDLRALVAHVRAGAADLEQSSAGYGLLARAAEWKARALLPVPPAEAVAPSEEEPAEAEAANLAERVAAYQAFAEAAEALRAYERQRREQFPRPAGVRASGPAAPASLGVASLDQLLGMFGEVWARSRPRSAEVQRERFTLADAAERLRQRLRAAPALFASLFAPDADRLEVVVTFLALLELVRRGEVAVRQESPFSPVELAWRGGRRGHGGPEGEGDGP